MRDKITDFPRGSEWRIWDLHIHTPASFHWADGASFLTLDEEGKNKAIAKAIAAINKSPVSVFAITDYWAFDGYKRIQSMKSTNPLTKTVFPGIELRIEAATDYRLNVQVILSDQLSAQQLNDFLSKLQIRFGKDKSRPLSEEALKEYAKGLDDGKAKKHGFKAVNQLTDQELILLGSQTAKVTINSLEEALKTLPENSAFVVIPWELNDGLEKLDWEKHPHDDSCLITYANFIESRSLDAVDLFLHKETDKNKDIINDFKQYLKHRKIPVVCGSDAHKFADYGKAHDSKYCWVKSDPSFEGLRQVLYEPGDRVKVQEDKPDEKKPYYLIDRVRYVDNTGNNWFASTDIVLNQNLNVIIGGKSTGKSLLLYHIAKAIDPTEVVSRVSDVATLPNYDHFTLDTNFDFDIVWKDGSTSSIKQNTGLRKILYIPQSYLSMLSETTTQSQKALNEFILNVITQDKEVKDSKENEEQAIIKECNDITELVNAYFVVEQQAKLKKDLIEKTGDEEGIKKYIKELNQKIENVKKQSGLSQEEMKAIKTLLADKQRVESDAQELQQDKTTIDALYLAIDLKLQEIESVKNEKIAYVVNKSLSENLKKQIEWLDELREHLAKDTNASQKVIDKQEKELDAKIKEVNLKLKPLIEKVKLQKKLNELIGELKEEERKLKKIQLLKINFKTDIKQLSDIRTKAKEKYKEVFFRYKELQSNLKKGESQLEDISLNIGIDFKEDKFNQECIELYLNKVDLKRILSIKGDEEFFYKYDERHLDNIGVIFEKTLSGDIGTIKNRTRKEAVLKLLEDYYQIRFSITYKNDPLDRMSPGKRALVLLKLLIYLSQEEYPILIDQPESDLDNRSVYVDLVRFIKEKKKERQIIAVTHNPNLVVSADAEEVIVANQRGQDPTKENKQYQFEYVSGGLENSLPEDPSEQAVLYQKGIREHVCEILEGGEEAFKKREMKYNLPDTISSAA